MATFVLLPPRELLGKALVQHVHDLLPGVPLAEVAGAELARTLIAVLERDSNVYAVHREDLPAGEEPTLALEHGYGAEPSDRIIDVRLTAPVVRERAGIVA